MRGILRQLLTGRDNQTYDPARVAWAVAFVHFLAMHAYSVLWLHQPLDLLGFAQASGILLTAGGVAVAVKAHAEPGA